MDTVNVTTSPRVVNYNTYCRNKTIDKLHRRSKSDVVLFCREDFEDTYLEKRDHILTTIKLSSE